MADIKNVLREEGNELFNKSTNLYLYFLINIIYLFIFSAQILYSLLGKYREALQKYTEAINAYPNDYFSWSNRAITRIKVKYLNLFFLLRHKLNN